MKHGNDGDRAFEVDLLWTFGEIIEKCWLLVTPARVEELSLPNESMGTKAILYTARNEIQRDNLIPWEAFTAFGIFLSRRRVRRGVGGWRKVTVKSRGSDDSAGHVQVMLASLVDFNLHRDLPVALLLCEAYTSISSEDVSGIRSVDRLSL